MKRFFKSYLFLGLFSALIIGLDQVTKAWIRTTIPVGAAIAPIEGLSPFFRFVHWYNTGAAFGMLQGFGDIFTILAVVVAFVIIYYYSRVPDADWTLRLAMGFQLGGAMGNLIDRLTIGHVIDFIAIGNFPVFNIADASITVGVAVLILGMLIQEWKTKKSAKEEAAAEGIDDSSKSEGMN